MPSAKVLSPHNSNEAPAEGGLLGTRRALLVGFGVLLVLLVLCGLNALAVLSSLQTNNESILGNFLEEQRRLDQVRSNIYLSGTYLRDYLLEPDPAKAEQSRAALESARAQISATLAHPGLLSGSRGNDDLHAALEREIGEYWQTLDPVLSWKAEQRHRQGYRFLHDEVFPRRSSTLSIADTIASVNQRQLLDRDERLLSLFGSFRNRLVIALVLMVVFGIVQAAASTIHLLRMERKTVAHLMEVTEARQELRDLSAKLVTTQETERKNLSRELHDAVGQSLSAVQFELHDLVAVLDQRQGPPLRGRIDRIRELVEGCLAMTRNLARLLRPAMLDDLGLAAALEGQAREISRYTGVHVTVDAEGLSAELPDEHKISLFRIVQEALNNVCRHANADSVKITVGISSGCVWARIEDDGRGFRPGETKGLGLIGMQERVAALGGTLGIDSQPGTGTRIEVRLPVPQFSTPVPTDRDLATSRRGA
jgi:signal transduction histidine kinase